MSHWNPAGSSHYSGLGSAPEPPAPGTLLANKRVLWRVHAIHERHRANWTDDHESALQNDLRRRDWLRKQKPDHEYRTRWAELVTWDGQPETWPYRPRNIEIHAAADGKRLHLRWPHGGWRNWYPVGAHHAVCASCGELYPCREVDAAQEASREMVRVEHLMSIGPGCCWHCKEPITHRQQARTFPGENLLLPGAPSAQFHTRRTGGCWDAAYQYEKRWRAADPARADEPSLFPGEPWERP